MPKIDVDRDRLIARLECALSGPELEKLLESAKAECEAPNEETLRVELNDTNRPDLWSEAGLVRQLRMMQGGALPKYAFFSSEDASRPAAAQLQVEASVAGVRPYIVAALARGPAIDAAFLDELIQMQEKLSENYGRRRESLAIGIYRLDAVQFPLHYRAVVPESLRFIPLGMEQSLNLRQILSEHPKGIEYADLVQYASLFPILTDDRGKVLSFPPIINSNDLGQVEVGDGNFFIECTGSSLDTLFLALAIITCNLADEGYAIEPVSIHYPSDTPYGRHIISPFYFQQKVRASRRMIDQMLGLHFTDTELACALQQAGVPAVISQEAVEITPPPYRNDFLHGVDVVEEIMIGKGMAHFSPQMLDEFTIGRLLPQESLFRQLRSLMVGLGFQEMVCNYLGSEKDFIQNIYPESQWDEMRQVAVRVENPLSESHALLRFSPLPSQLMAESSSSNAVYPHAIFEIGETAIRAEQSEWGTLTRSSLGFLYADVGANFNVISRQVSALLYYLSLPYQNEKGDDSRMIPGRCAIITSNKVPVGVFGELHPRVLKAWNIMMPCVYAEIFLDTLMDIRYGL